MTILGPLPCIRCKAPVTVVKRAASIEVSDRRGTNQHRERTGRRTVELPWLTVVLPVSLDGARHACETAGK